MADKTVITPQQRFKVLTKLFEAGFKSEKDLLCLSRKKCIEGAPKST